MNDAVRQPDPGRLAWMYRQMLRIREFEERVKATFTEHLVTALDATVPYGKPMEDYILPDEEKIVSAVRSVLAVTS